MKKRFSDEQKVRIVAESRAHGVPATAKKHGVSEHSVYLWRRTLGGLEVNQVAEMKRLQQENGRLKKNVADQSLALDIAKEAMAKKSWACRVDASGYGACIDGDYRWNAAAGCSAWRVPRWTISRSDRARTPSCWHGCSGFR